MATELQLKACEKSIREYRKRFLTKKANLNADESTARLMVNEFLNNVLGYTLIEEIKTEHMIRETYVDYVVQLGKKIEFVVEAKATSLDLTSRHLKQAIDYAANEGVDWAILTNGRHIELHRVIFEKPIRSQKIFSYDLSDLSTIKTASRHIFYLSKKSVSKGELEKYWKRFDTLSEKNMKKIITTPEVIRAIRLQVKKKSGINFDDKEIIKSLNNIIIDNK